MVDFVSTVFRWHPYNWTRFLAFQETYGRLSSRVWPAVVFSFFLLATAKDAMVLGVASQTQGSFSWKKRGPFLWEDGRYRKRMGEESGESTPCLPLACPLFEELHCGSLSRCLLSRRTSNCQKLVDPFFLFSDPSRKAQKASLSCGYTKKKELAKPGGGGGGKGSPS